MNAMKQLTSLAYGLSLAMVAGGAAAHGLDDIGAPACLEANFMMADAMNNDPTQFGPAGAPWADANGPGQVLEVNIVTGKRGITVANPFAGPDTDPNGPVCDNGSGYINCNIPKSPFKPTGVLSGGLNGHAFITSAAQQALTEFHRDGTPIRSISYRPITGNPTGNAGLGTLPRPLGTQMMPNGNIIQAICDANFFNASNSDLDPNYDDPNGGHNTSWQYFPPVYSTAERAQNSRLLVIDQETLSVIDEYSYPYDDDRAELWGCMAGIAFTDEGMGVSMFHTAAIAMVDWMDGLEDDVAGVGSNDTDNDFEIGGGNNDDDSHDHHKKGKHDNEAKILRWIDLRAWSNDPEDTVPDDDPTRRDSLRAWGLDEDGTIYVTDRERSRACLQGETAWDGSPTPCGPPVFRQKVQVVDLGDSYPSRTIGLDPGVNVIAGIRPNRMSATACDNIGGPTAGGTNPDGTACDVETLLLAASAFNPISAGGGFFKPGGGVGEYSIHPDDADGASAPCTGAHGAANAADNVGCAQPIATFLGKANGKNQLVDNFVDPRMLMVIHEAFVQ